MSSSEIFGVGFGSLPERQRLEKAAHELEAVVLSQLLSSMRKAVPEGSLFGKSAGTDVFQAMLDTELARSAAAKSPFGLAEALIDSFDDHVKKELESTDSPEVRAVTPERSPEERPARREWRG